MNLSNHKILELSQFNANKLPLHLLYFESRLNYYSNFVSLFIKHQISSGIILHMKVHPVVKTVGFGGFQTLNGVEDHQVECGAWCHLSTPTRIDALVAETSLKIPRHVADGAISLIKGIKVVNDCILGKDNNLN